MYSQVKTLMIKPHERYQPRVKYPEVGLLVHHPSYLTIAKELAAKAKDLVHIDDWEYATHYRQKFTYKGIPFFIDDARDNAKDTIRHELQNYFWGARTLVNIGAAGGINPALEIGSYVVGERAVRDNGVDRNLASSDVAAESNAQICKMLYKTASRLAGKQHSVKGDIWTVANKYYSFADLDAVRIQGFNPQAVDMEMAAFCIMASWINANYAATMSELRVGSLFYISDLLPRSPSEKWVDPMIDLSKLVAFKTQSLLIAINSLASLSGN